MSGGPAVCTEGICVGDLGSVVSCPVRGTGGDARYPGNWGGEFVRRVLGYFEPASVMDVMAGSGTTGDVCSQLGIRCDCYDLRPDAPQGRGGWDVLSDEPERGAQMVLCHLPYADMYVYSEIWGGKRDPRDLSAMRDWPRFLDQCGKAMARMLQWVDIGGYVGVLMGSIRRRGILYDMALDVPRPGPVTHRLVKVQHNERSRGRAYSGKFIAIEHEDFLVFRRDAPYVFAGCVPKRTEWDVRRSPRTTWRGAVYAALVALGGEATMAALYAEIEQFAIAQRPENAHWRAKVRQTLQLGADFEAVERGRWRLRGDKTAA